MLGIGGRRAGEVRGKDYLGWLEFGDKNFVFVEIDRSKDKGYNDNSFDVFKVDN